MGMTLKHYTWQFLIDVMRSERLVLPGLRMAELGNQHVWEDVFGQRVAAKQVFERFGVEHVSFDRNGENGAIKLDLGEPLPAEHHGFDIVTNIGTAEHVETNQEQCFANIHALCRVGGVIAHVMPEAGSWRGHCKIRYAASWVESLATSCGYEVIQFGIHGDNKRRLITAAYRKTSSPFKWVEP